MADYLASVRRSISAWKPSPMATALRTTLLLLAVLFISWQTSVIADDSNSTEPSGQKDSTAEKSIDVKSVMSHNRAWLHPQFDHLKSVSFSHVTSPKRLVESFDWRADGMSLLEIIERPDWIQGIGRRELTMPDGSFHFYSPESKYSEPKSVPAGGTERYIREHLRGTRMNFVALDWGAEPEQFQIRKIRPNDDGTLSVTLKPLKTPYRINVGVMFHYTSWAYIHDFDIALAELRIDPVSHRILREADYSDDGERQVEIEFRDWKTIADGQEVPLQIHVQIPNKNQFEVEYSFQWPEEGLWILKKSSGAFDGKDPQQAEIVDLAVNQSTPRLDRAADRFEKTKTTLQEPTSETQKITLQGLFHFEVGKTIPMQKISPERFPILKNLLFAFDLDDPSSNYNHCVELTAELDLERFDAAKMGDRQLLLTFLDREGLPIQAHYATLATASANEQTAMTIAENLCKHNAPWLSPARKDKFSYVYRQGTSTKHITVDDQTAVSERQGFTLSTSFEDLLRSPETYRVPVQFEGVYEGKPVVFAAFRGKSLDHQCGNGISGGWQGYMSYLNSTGLVLFEKETWRPLVVRVGYLEIQYRDYVEVAPGVSAPLRILIAEREGDMRFDFRFKILDGKLWLFDRGYRDEKVVTSTEDVSWNDEKVAAITARSTEEGVPLKELKAFDFHLVTDRRAVDTPESATLRGVMAQTRPWEYPGYADLMKTALATVKQDGATKLCVNLGSAELLKDASFFTLTWISPHGDYATIPGPQTTTVNAYLIPRGDSAKVKLFSGDVSFASSGLLSAQINKAEAGYEAKVEYMDDTQDKGLIANISLAIVNSQGSILAGAWRNFSFVNYEGIHSGEQLLNLGRLENAPPLYLIPRYHTIIYAYRMGSSLGTTIDRYTPPLAWNQILSAEDSRVWGYGLQLMQKHVNDQLGEYHYRDFPPNDMENYVRKQIVSPHIDTFARLLKTTKEPKYLVILAQLAGHTGDPQFRELLLPLLEHSDKEVRAAAAIHLCRLGDARGLKLILETFAEELQNIPESKEYSPISPRLVEIFMDLHIVDNDEVISTLGDAFLSWRKRSFNEHGFSDFDRNGNQTAFKYMLGVLGCSKRPQAVGYLCRALRSEKRDSVQQEILTQLRSHENDQEVFETIIAGLEDGKAKYFNYSWQSPEINEIMAKKLLDPELENKAFSIAVTHFTYDKKTRSYDVLREAYERKLHADNPELRSAVICGLAHHGDHQHLPEAFDLLVKVVGEPQPPAADKEAAYERKRKIDRIGGSVYGIARHFPPEVVAKFLHTKDAEKQPAVREAVQFLLENSRDIATAYKSPPLSQSDEQP